MRKPQVKRETILSGNKVFGFTQQLLLPRFDEPVSIPGFHRELWELCNGENKRVAIAAPRGFAKSTAITLSLTLARFLFRVSKYGLIVSDTEAQASLFLGDIKNELEDNEELKQLFGVKRFTKDGATDIIVEMHDGYKFRIQAVGAEQKVRGRKWYNRRPDFIVIDDLENDEMIENDDRRSKLRNWFFKALIPCLSKNGMVAYIGTILHEDALLSRLQKNKSWHSKLYKAHKAFDDFSELLWPEQHSEASLRAIRQEFIDDNYAEGYAQEYLNDPTQHSEAFFKKELLLPMEDGDFNLKKNYYAGVDLAISDADRSAYTAIVVGGVDEFNNLQVEHAVRLREDVYGIISVMLAIQQRYNVQGWFVEKGQISLSIEGEMIRRQQESGIFLEGLQFVTPTKDKRARARAIQARIRAKAVKFNKEAEWWPAFEHELITFPKGTYKDQVDALAWLGICISSLSEGPTKAEYEEERWEQAMERAGYFDYNQYADEMTGY